MLRDAELDAATLRMADDRRRHAGAKLQGSDMRGTVVWRTLPPGGEFPRRSPTWPRSPCSRRPRTIWSGSAHRWRGSTTVRSRRGSRTAWLGCPTPPRTAPGLRPPINRRGRGSRRPAKPPMPTATRGASPSIWRGSCAGRASPMAPWPPALRAAPWHRDFQGDMPALYVRLRGTDCAASPPSGPPLLRESGHRRRRRARAVGPGRAHEARARTVRCRILLRAVVAGLALLKGCLAVITGGCDFDEGLDQRRGRRRCTTSTPMDSAAPSSSGTARMR